MDDPEHNSGRGVVDESTVLKIITWAQRNNKKVEELTQAEIVEALSSRG